MQQKYPSRIGKVFSLIALIEGVTWAGLLIGMFLKHVTNTTELGVWLFGRLHGAAFLIYVVVVLIAAPALRWPWWATGVAFLASLPPLATLPVEVWFRRRGLLARSPVS